MRTGWVNLKKPRPFALLGGASWPENTSLFALHGPTLTALSISVTLQVAICRPTSNTDSNGPWATAC